MPVPEDVVPVLEIFAPQVPGSSAEGVEVPGVVPLLGIPGVLSGAVLFPGVRGALSGEALLLGVTGVRLGALGLVGVDV
jgi:hypothetical protein